jgi:hypothetical protein
MENGSAWHFPLAPEKHGSVAAKWHKRRKKADGGPTLMAGMASPPMGETKLASAPVKTFAFAPFVLLCGHSHCGIYVEKI